MLHVHWPELMRFAGEKKVPACALATVYTHSRPFVLRLHTRISFYRASLLKLTVRYHGLPSTPKLLFVRKHKYLGSCSRFLLSFSFDFTRTEFSSSVSPSLPFYQQKLRFDIVSLFSFWYLLLSSYILTRSLPPALKAFPALIQVKSLFIFFRTL